MLVDVRPTQRLRGPRQIDVTACLGPILRVLCEDSVDLSRLRLVCDWIQYRDNFRDVIDIRPILAAAGNAGAPPPDAAGPAGSAERLEIAIDLRRCVDDDCDARTREALQGHQQPDALPRRYLEDWRPTRQSCIWGFNALYWQALSAWEAATGQGYERALPGGQSDARNVDGVRELILELFRVWDELSARDALPGELYVVELGVGNGNQAKAWLDEFIALDRARGRDYYRRLHYIMGDYSPHVLRQAQQAVAGHPGKVSSLVLDATAPATTLGFLRQRAFLVYVSNVYDNLPSDEIAVIGGHPYLVEVRAYLPHRSVERLARDASAGTAALPGMVEKLLKLGPELASDALPRQLPTVSAAVDFWRTAWRALRLEERYVPLEGLDRYEVSPGVTGEALRPLLEADGDIRMPVSNGAVAGFDDSLPLLHPRGRLVCHDLFVTHPHQFRTRFPGPGKYEGSVVNWVNGPLLQRLAARRGFDVDFTPFAHRQGSNITTLTALSRDRIGGLPVAAAAQPRGRPMHTPPNRGVATTS
ncbi:MAG: hypothetical protein ACRDPK_02005 [Carbonactinosporaceae bacterium]